ncbi:MAG: GTP pyrophosphokinase family protein [Amphibacillus sp.]|nr:GTP pyrophosphokinase family protein [Amphibacillus sp.]
MKEELEINPNHFKDRKKELLRFLMGYKFALEQLKTKIDLLKSEFKHIHDYNPIEHVTSRVKTPESIMRKAQKKGYPLTLESIRKNIRDIAGLRITCSFESDIYVIHRMLEEHGDVNIIEEKDYINNPKGNGYRSLHLIVEVPVFMTDREQRVLVEIQIRTIAMDFWASLEHKIFYKYNREIPEHIKHELAEAAEVAHMLDKKMEALHTEVNLIKSNHEEDEEVETIQINDEQFRFPVAFINRLTQVNWM